MHHTPSAVSHLGFNIRDLGIWFVLVSLVGTTMLHYLTDIHLIPYHSIYRSLYYIPIAVAAVRYGRRGGVLAALTTTVLYIPHVVISWGAMPSDGFNDLLENVIFLFVGILAGGLADAERRQRQRAQEAADQLTAANAQLQEQAAIAERMRTSIASILESVDSGIITLDATSQITRVNRAAQVLLDCPLHVGDTAPALLRDYLGAGGRGYRQVAVSGRTLGLHGAPLVGAWGETIGNVLVLDDLTEVHVLEEQIQRTQRLAALGRLAGGLAHEIRNPLGIVRAAAQMLHQHLADDAMLGEYTQVMQTEIDRVDRLIEQLLAYAHPRLLRRGLIDIADLLERATMLTHAYASQQGLSLSVETEAGLPLIEGDTDLLHQALLNLVLNAIQATPAGGVVRVEASRSAHGSQTAAMVTLSVSDTGSGIAPGDLPHIFDPFFTTRSDGTGLGLSIVQQIVQEHGGSIDVQSERGVGTTFVLRLPSLPSDDRVRVGQLSGASESAPIV